MRWLGRQRDRRTPPLLTVLEWQRKLTRAKDAEAALLTMRHRLAATPLGDDAVITRGGLRFRIGPWRRHRVQRMHADNVLRHLLEIVATGNMGFATRRDVARAMAYAERVLAEIERTSSRRAAP